jgi:cellobiose phosphorylase
MEEPPRTGTAAWNYVAIAQSILGIRPTYEGLRIAPVIPGAWDGFEAVRQWRGSVLRIVVHNPDHVCRGILRIRLDAVELDGDLIPLDVSPGEHRVEVWLGNSRSRAAAAPR